MRRIQHVHWLVFLLATFVGAFAAPCLARSVLSGAPSAAELRSEQVRLLSPYDGRRTLRFQQLTNLLPEVTGRPSLAKYIKYGGNFRRYWQAAEPAFVGKGFEAILAHRENALRAATGRPNRLLVTAAEGFNTDAADLVELADDGRVLRRFQAKLGVGAATQAVFDAKYSHMTVITTPESLGAIREEIARRQANAMRRGITLDPYTQRIADAVVTGRLTDRIAGGIQAPSRREAIRIVRHTLVGEWRTLGRVAGPPTRFATNIARPILTVGRLWQSHQILARSLFLADVGFVAYQTYSDFGRYRAGEISGGYLAFKASLRSTQVGLTAYAAIASADPATKGIAAISAGFLVVVDVISDPLYAAWYQPTDVGLLSRLEYHERALCVRHTLMSQVQQLIGTSP